MKENKKHNKALNRTAGKCTRCRLASVALAGQRLSLYGKQRNTKDGKY